MAAVRAAYDVPFWRGNRNADAMLGRVEIDIAQGDNRRGALSYGAARVANHLY